ncbi:MAG: sulfite exporter TauE/SafE family protein, partial [Halobacteriota archaeon]|nr:sulfite exporter TauE/SafE family protein [Halobacteriota archaeon]
GSTVCAATCGPALASYVATEYDSGWRNGLRAGIIFNIPRIALITIFGAIVGYLSSILISPWLEGSLIDVLFVGYTVFGVYVIILGFTMYGRNKSPSHGFLHNVLSRLTEHATNNNRVLLLMGIILGAVCLLEVSLFDAIIISTASGLFGSSAGVSTMITGALAMFSFGVGSMVPLLLITTTSGGISKVIPEGSMDQARSILGISMMVVGTFIILSKITPLLFILGLI